LIFFLVAFTTLRDAMSSPRGQWLYGLLARLEKPLDRSMASLLRELYRRCCQLRAALHEDDHTFDVQIASLNVLIVITGSYFGQGEEYSTLIRGYIDDCGEEEDEGEGEDEEDFDDNDDDDDGQYYFDSKVVNRVEEPLPGGYSIGDDIWSDSSAMAIEDDHMHLSPNNEHGYSRSYLKKRTAEGSAEEGEELEGSEDDDDEDEEDEEYDLEES
jgi:Survival motor neuron (SMN) interacting protein 1 (SIP1)